MATISKTEEDLRTAICDKAEDGVNTAYSIGNDEGTKTALSPAEDDNNLKTARNHYMYEDDCYTCMNYDSEPENYYFDQEMNRMKNKPPFDKKPKLVRRASFYVDKELSIHAYYTDHRNQAVLKMIACGKMTSD